MDTALIQRAYEMPLGFALRPAIALAARHGLRVVETPPPFIVVEGSADALAIYGDEIELLLRLSR